MQDPKKLEVNLKLLAKEDLLYALKLLLYLYPNGLYKSDIARKLGYNLWKLKSKLKEFREQGIIKDIVLGNCTVVMLTEETIRRDYGG